MKNSFITDINVIKACYKNYSLVNGGKNIPDFSPYLNPNAEFKFNNVKYNCNDTLDLINVFCKNMNSIKVHILGEIKCLNPIDKSYLMLSNWECETIEGIRKNCPMMQIITINNGQIIKAVGVINMEDLLINIT